MSYHDQESSGPERTEDDDTSPLQKMIADISRRGWLAGNPIDQAGRVLNVLFALVKPFKNEREV